MFSKEKTSGDLHPDFILPPNYRVNICKRVKSETLDRRRDLTVIQKQRFHQMPLGVQGTE